MSISEIVYKSSEDPRYRAEKLLGNNRWLTDPKVNDDEASIIVKLKEKIKIQFIDIVYVNTASVEIFVRNSSEEGNSPLVRLVEVRKLLKENECRTGTQKKSGCTMFRARDHFLADARDKEWNEIKFVMKQPYARNKQMGFDLLRIVPITTFTPKKAIKEEVTSPIEERPSPSPRRSSPSSSSKKAVAMMGNTYAERMFLATKKPNNSPASGGGETPNSKTPLKRRLLLGKGDDDDDVTGGRQSPSSSNVAKQQKSRAGSAHHHHGESPFKRKLSASGGGGDVTMTKQGAAEVKRPRKIRIGGGKKFPEAVKRRFGVPQDGAAESEKKEAAGGDDHHSDEEQSRILTKSIKTYLNDVNLDDLDPSNIRVRDLRKKFEERFELELNTDGKSIFLNIIQNYLPMLYRYQYNGTSSNIRINEFSPRKAAPASVRKPSIAMGSSGSSSTTSVASSSGNLDGRTSGGDVTRTSSSTNGDIPTTSSSFTSISSDPPTSPSTTSQHQCPICQKYFPSDVIEVHAAECCDFPSNDPTASSPLTDDVIITPGAAASSALDDVQIINSFEDTPVDCSENSCLSKAEQEYWKAFAKKPKPYSARLNASDYEGVLLKKCPICFMKYKVSDLEEHSVECAAKVYSGKVRRGLYLVDSKKESRKTSSSASSSSSSRAGSSRGSNQQQQQRRKDADDDVIIID